MGCVVLLHVGPVQGRIESSFLIRLISALFPLHFLSHALVTAPHPTRSSRGRAGLCLLIRTDMPSLPFPVSPLLALRSAPNARRMIKALCFHAPSSLQFPECLYSAPVPPLAIHCSAPAGVLVDFWTVWVPETRCSSHGLSLLDSSST